MAHLKHNGTEADRIVGVRPPDEDGDVTEIQYSVRSNGWILAQTVRRPRKGRTYRSGWTRFARWNGSPEGAARILRQRMEGRQDLAEVR
jgi:hypothetical protein